MTVARRRALALTRTSSAAQTGGLATSWMGELIYHGVLLQRVRDDPNMKPTRRRLRVGRWAPGEVSPEVIHGQATTPRSGKRVVSPDTMDDC